MWKRPEEGLAVCSELGVPVATHKCVGPLTCITFLGIEVDMIALELRLPGEKLEKLRQLIADWQGRKSCKKRDLESLIGHLCHACKVVRPGHSTGLHLGVPVYWSTALILHSNPSRTPTTIPDLPKTVHLAE